MKKYLIYVDGDEIIATKETDESYTEDDMVSFADYIACITPDIAGNIRKGPLYKPEFLKNVLSKWEKEK